MIILIRHAQSEGNKNREIHQTIPDHRVQLTPEGHRQAREAGSKLRALLRPDDTIHFFTSPYRRTRETTEGILESLTSDSPSPSPFPRHTIKVYEEPRLREQDFGNFQPCSAEMERMWLERADYGHFFYRIPNGESAADAYDRISGFNESLWRLFGEDDFASVCVLVTHGLMTRVFLMKWYHWSVEYFEDLRNINHCEFVIMKLNPDNGKYVLQNKLRTWSELRKEKENERQRERTSKGLGSATSLTPASTPVVIRRKWGGCPDGCNHGLHRKWSLRSSRTTGGDPTRVGSETQSSTRSNVDQQYITAPEPALGDCSSDIRPTGQTIAPSDDPSKRDVEATSQPTILPTGLDANTDRNIQTSKRPSPHPRAASSPNPIPRRPNLAKFHRDSEDHLLHPPRSNYALHHLGGRDGGSSLSGENSVTPSEDEREDAGFSGDRLDQHKPNSSHDFTDDGDDESHNKQVQRPKRTRSHHKHSHNHTHHSSSANPSNSKRGEIDVDTNRSQDTTYTPAELPSQQDSHNEHAHNDNNHGEDAEDDADAELEAERQHDQSIRGSVY
ncbi:phosphoglycerate mutase [Aspergillus fumigatus]|nr:phosphoglycerate mutase [Aspergillus fumigatus]